jgi:hypothetical protein
VKKRLVHSWAAQAQTINLTRYQVCVLVEGRRDVPFYGRAFEEARRVDQALSTYQIIRASELDPSGAWGGKEVLLRYHAFLRKRRRLRTDTGKRKHCVVFALDKDLDDLSRSARKCPHIRYTQNYCLENYFFRHGRVAHAISCSFDLESQHVEDEMRRRGEWRQMAASSWADWIACCLMAKLKGLRVENYNTPTSTVHDGAWGPVNAAKLDDILNRMSLDAGVPRAEVDAWFKTWRQRVNGLAALDELDAVFSGKWYVGFAEASARSAARQMHSPPKSLGNVSPQSVLACLMSTLDFRDAWAKGLVEWARWALRSTV